MIEEQEKILPEQEKQFNDTWEPPAGLPGWFTAVSNSDIGNRYMITSFIYFLLGGIMALLMRTQLAVSENDFLGPDVYNGLFTMHGSTMMFLFVVPFLEGTAIYIVPAILGSRDMAFPRVSGFSYWIFLGGGMLFFLSFLFGAVPNAGWFAYPPLSGPDYSGVALDFWLVGLGFIEFGGLAAGVEFVVSILKLRAPGMTLTRMPLYAWAWLVTGFMIVFAFTTLFTASLMLELDRALGTRFFDPNGGGSTLLWQHLFWFFGHPEVYIMFIPATGIVSSIVPVFARRPIVGYNLIVVAIVVTGFLSFGLWVHHMFTTGLPEFSLSFFTAASLMIAIASGTQIFSWIATLWGGRTVVKTPLLFILGFVFIFVLGGLTGVMVALVPFDLQVHDTYFLVAHFHYVLIGGVVFPILGGLYYWLPKITGKMLHERLGRWTFWLTFIGFNVTFFPMHIMGFQGMPRRVYTYPASLGLDGLNLLATIGSYTLALGFLLFIVDVARSLRYGEEAGNDPWGGDSWEWAVASPPPQANIDAPPIIHSRHPLWDEFSENEGDELCRRARAALDRKPVDWRGILGTTVLDARPEVIHPVSGPGYAPFFTAVGFMFISIGEIFKFHALSIAGLVIGIAAIAVWIWPDEACLKKIRASKLPEQYGLPIVISGSRSLGWWAMIGFIVPTAVVLGNLIYSYFYIRLYSETWPQGGLPLPELPLPAAIYALLAASALPQSLAGRCFRQGRGFATGMWLAGSFLVALLFLGLQWSHLIALEFGPQRNAYASLFYVTSWVASGLVLIALGLNLMSQLRLWKEGADPEGFAKLLVEITTLFWLYTVVVAFVVFGMLYVSPYL